MRRFYKAVTWAPAPGGYVLRLDDKILRTPLSHAVLLESADLTAAIADEWIAQSDTIVPASMQMMQLANTMIDKGLGDARNDIVQHVLIYAGSDLICYFADHPAKLTARHEALWRPLLGWLEKCHGIRLEAVQGIRHHQQPEGTIEKFKKLLESLSPADFTVVQAAAGTAGSLVIALALLEGQLDAHSAWEAACVDEIFQLEMWGEDAEARSRLERIKKELAMISQFSDLVKART